MEPLILSLHGMTDSSGAWLLRPRPLLPPLLPISPIPAAAALSPGADVVAMLRAVQVIAERPTKGKILLLLLRAAEGRMKPLEDVAR